MSGWTPPQTSQGVSYGTCSSCLYPPLSLTSPAKLSPLTGFLLCTRQGVESLLVSGRESSSENVTVGVCGRVFIN